MNEILLLPEGSAWCDTQMPGEGAAPSRPCYQLEEDSVAEAIKAALQVAHIVLGSKAANSQHPDPQGLKPT